MGIWNKSAAFFLLALAMLVAISSACGGGTTSSSTIVERQTAPPEAAATADARPSDTPSPNTLSLTSTVAAAPYTAAPTPENTPNVFPTPAPTIQRPTATPARAASPTAQATPVVQTRVQNKGVIFAYYVPYDPTSWASLQAHADSIDYVAPQWVTIDACGNVGSRDDRTLVAFARARGVRVLPSLLTSSEELNHRLLTDSAASSRAIQQIVAYIVEEGYDGLDLDLEGVRASDRGAYTAFVKRLSSAMRNSGKMLTAAIPAKTYDARTGWAGAYEYAAIAPYFDLVTIMTYEYSSPLGKPGSTAPFDWFDRVAAYVTSQIPPAKTLMGVAFYGYDWNLTAGGRARALTYSQAAALAKKFGQTIALDPGTRSATFSYTLKPGDTLPADVKLPPLNHEIAVRSLPSCPMTPATPTPRPTTTLRPTPLPTAPQAHEVWLEDSGSVTARLDIALKRGAAGIGTWRLGQEDPAVWPVLSGWRRDLRR